MVELLASNTQRLEQNDEEHRRFEEKFQEGQNRQAEFQDKAQRRHEEFQQRSQRHHEEILAQLHYILQRLTGNNQKPHS
jgi:hypothetical protein